MASDSARALIEGIINGELTQTNRTEVVRLRFARSFLPLSFTPVTSVTSVTIGGDVMPTADYHVTPLGLVRVDGQDWPASTDVMIEYVTGWVSGSEPTDVQAALARVDAIDVGVTSEKVGDVSLQRSAEGTLSGVRLLVQRWVRP